MKPMRCLWRTFVGALEMRKSVSSGLVAERIRV
jgi:hypothetical protein